VLPNVGTSFFAVVKTTVGLSVVNSLSVVDDKMILNGSVTRRGRKTATILKWTGMRCEEEGVFPPSHLWIWLLVLVEAL
jgi:hypothetical protein